MSQSIDNNNINEYRRLNYEARLRDREEEYQKRIRTMNLLMDAAVKQQQQIADPSTMASMAIFDLLCAAGATTVTHSARRPTEHSKYTTNMHEPAKTRIVRPCESIRVLQCSTACPMV